MDLLKLNKKSLTKTDRQIMDVINNNMQKVCKCNIDHFAKLTFCSKATISRFVRKFGYINYKEFIIDLNYKYKKYSNKVNEKDTGIIQTILKQEEFALENLNIKNRDVVIEETVHSIESSKRIIILGTGSSNFAAQELHNNLSKIRLNSFSDPSIDRMMPVIATMEKEDLLIIITKSAKHNNIVTAINQAHKNKSKIVLITSNGNHNFDKFVDINIFHGNEEQILRTGALTSKISQNIIVDLIYNVLVHKNKIYKDRILKISNFFEY